MLKGGVKGSFERTWRVLVNVRLTVHLLPASPALVVEALVASMFLLDARCMLHRGNVSGSCQ